jgi:hypothetical protein
MKEMRPWIAAGVAFLVVVAQAHTCHAVSNGTQAGSFLMIGSGARAASMGEAFTGLADDVSAAYWNPAGLVQLPSLQATLCYAAWFADTSYSVVSLGAPIAPGHCLAASVYYFHVPTIANVPESVEPAVDLSNYAAGVSYACGLTDRLSIGGGIKMLSQDITQAGRADSSASSALIDLGVLYRNEDPDISGGLLLQNMGPKLEFRDAGSPAPFWARAGVAWRVYRDEWLSVVATADAAQPVDTGYKLVIPSGGISDIFKISLKGPRQNRYNYGFGTEWWIADLLALRAGYVTRVGSDIDTPSAGAGLKFTVDPFVYALDYSYSFWGDLSANVSRVSFAISLAPRPRAPEE